MPIPRRSDVARCRALKRLPLFSGCSHQELRRISSMTTEIHVEAGHVLILTGQAGREFFIVLEGVASVWRQGIRLDRIGPGSFFGELSLLDRGRRSATVAAETDMRLLVMTSGEFASTWFLIQPVLRTMVQEMGKRLRRADDGWAQNAAPATRFDPPVDGEVKRAEAPQADTDPPFPVALM